MAYDKEKAHEYYMNYVKKGVKKGRGKKSQQAESDRKSTKGLNDDGKEAAKQAKAQINAERKEAYAALKAEMQEKINAIKERITQAKGNKSDDLLTMSTDDVDALKQEIEQLRTDMKAEKEKIKAEYEEKYLAVLDEIKSDKEYKAVKKSRKKKK